MSQESIPLGMKLIHRYFLDNPTFIFDLCWDGWGLMPEFPRDWLDCEDLWVTPAISSKSLCMTEHSRHSEQVLAFSLKHAFPDSESIHFRVFYNLDENFRNNHIQSLSVIALPSIYLFPFAFFTLQHFARHKLPKLAAII